MRFSPSSSHLPSPTARTLPRCGFSFAVSGRTMPLAVVSSSSIACTIRRSPKGLSFIDSTSVYDSFPGTHGSGVPSWHSSTESATLNERPDGLVLGGRVRPQALADLGWAVGDLGEAHDGH